MHFALTDEQEMIVSTVRRFVETEIYPHEDAVERAGRGSTRTGAKHQAKMSLILAFTPPISPPIWAAAG